MAREARRDAPRLKAADENATAEKPEAGTAQRFEPAVAAAPPAAEAVEAEAFSDEALEEALRTDPETWIRQLLELQAQGDTDALEAGIAAFRSAYPEYQLPPELDERIP